MVCVSSVATAPGERRGGVSPPYRASGPTPSFDGRTGSEPSIGVGTSGALDRIAKPNDAAIQHLGGHGSKRLAGGGHGFRRAFALKNAGASGQSIEAGINEQADFVEEARVQEGAVDDAAALEQQGARAKDIAQRLQRDAEVLAVRAGEAIGDPVVAELREVAVGNVLAENRNDGVAASIVLAVVQNPARIERDGKVAALPVGEVRSARNRAEGARRSRRALGVGYHGLPADDPSVRRELRRGRVVIAKQRRAVDAVCGRRPAIGKQSPVDRAHHVADDLWPHQPLRRSGRIRSALV